MRLRLSSLVLILVSCHVLWAAPAHGQSAVDTEIDRAEVMGWSDPDAALKLLDRAQTSVRQDDTLIRLLTVRGLLFVDNREDVGARAIIDRLRSMQGSAGMSSMVASHIVQAYLLCQSDEYARARAELDAIPFTAPATPLEQYRLEMLRGAVMRFLGQHEAALMASEQAFDIAHAMKSPSRELRAMMQMTLLYVRVGNLDRASEEAAAARALAEAQEDEAALANIAQQEADIEDRRGNRSAERRASLESLEHAQRVGNPRLLAPALANLGDSYMKTGEYQTSLSFSRRALEHARTLRRNGLEQTIEFNMGIAMMGVGRVQEGKRLAESATQKALDSGNVMDADGNLREYADTLERLGDYRGALNVHHREDELREKLMTTDRHRALLELSAKFDDERKAREIELLKRDNAIKSGDLRAQGLRQQLIVVTAVLIAIACAALAWAIFRIRKVNQRLRYASEHDELTGLKNRRYFNEHILTRDSDRAFLGSVLLIDLDHFKRTNDTYGHPAGDKVLDVISKRLAAALRENDTLVRWGGEEFLVVLGPMTSQQSDATALRLLDVVRREPVMWQGRPIHCTISIGYASFPLAGANTEINLDRAISLVDKALYQAKQRGRDRACLISLVRAGTEKDLASINAEFEAAAADRRVQLVDTVSEAA
jgi:diguanylate cyclase (GGDEF)-like protein